MIIQTLPSMSSEDQIGGSFKSSRSLQGIGLDFDFNQHNNFSYEQAFGELRSGRSGSSNNDQKNPREFEHFTLV